MIALSIINFPRYGFTLCLTFNFWSITCLNARQVVMRDVLILWITTRPRLSPWCNNFANIKVSCAIMSWASSYEVSWYTFAERSIITSVRQHRSPDRPERSISMAIISMSLTFTVRGTLDALFRPHLSALSFHITRSYLTAGIIVPPALTELCRRSPVRPGPIATVMHASGRVIFCLSLFRLLELCCFLWCYASISSLAVSTTCSSDCLVKCMATRVSHTPVSAVPTQLCFGWGLGLG